MSQAVDDPRAVVLRRRRDEPWLARWGRRALSVPGLLVAALVVGALLPPLLLLAVLVDIARRRPLPLARALLVVAAYLACEALGIVASLALGLVRPFVPPARSLAWTYCLQGAWAAALLRALRRAYGVSLEVEGLDRVGPGPLLVLARHTSAADTLLPVVLLSNGLGLRLRYVLKRPLLWDPCLDLVGQRLPNAFVARGAERTDDDVAAVAHLARGLGPGDAVLIYPEGTRFTPARRAAALERLAASRRPHLVERARRLEHVLPPRLGGALALLEASDADVLFFAHTGLEGTARLADLLAGGLIGARVRVALWRVPRAEVPTCAERRAEWLHDQWDRLDGWVGATRGSQPRANGG